MKFVARPQRDGEPDLLAGHEREPVFLRSLSLDRTLRIDPSPIWTHDALDALLTRYDVKVFLIDVGGAEAFVGGTWIGSTEV
ncbi:conserved protein of unknown function (plasmid) [Pararobbsia alpina]|uniref:hypothetical protein n=1 Tax=Pararobbsia alpina TaxID=621374 RepID=UPI0039A584B5